jgi:hypothetical protein
MATKQKLGRPPKLIRIPDSFENVVKALVKPVKDKSTE